MKIRVTALLILFFATFVLLANAVIPHHHHDKEICIVSSHCESEKEAHDHDPAEHNHEHDGQSNLSHCALQQIMISPPGKIKHEIKSLDLGSDFRHDRVQAILIDSNVLAFSHYCLHAEKPPTIQIHYLNFASTAMGLRAPPAV